MIMTDKTETYITDWLPWPHDDPMYASVRIWWRTDGHTHQQRHEWRRKDGSAYTEKWINSFPDRPKNSHPVADHHGVLDALEIRFTSCDGDDLTIRDYLRLLLTTLWNEGEGFSGKRPFGDSGWDHELYAPLIVNGYIDGTVDEDGYIIHMSDDAAAHAYVNDLILAAFYGVNSD